MAEICDTVFFLGANFLNDGRVQVFNRLDPADGLTFDARDVTNFNWRDDAGVDTYFNVVMTFNAAARTLLVQINGITLTLENPADMTPVANPFVVGDTASTVLSLMGYESNNALFDTTAYIDDVLITVGGETVMNNGFETAQGLEKGPLDGQPAGVIPGKGDRTVWDVTAGSPITFVSGNNPHSGSQSMELRRNAGSGFVFTGVEGNVDPALGVGNTIIDNWIAIGNGSVGLTADDVGSPTMSCRQVGTVADPDDEGETCCEFEWSYTNTSSDFTLLGGFIAIEAGNGGPCSNTPDEQEQDDIDFFFGDISFCRADVGGAGWIQIGSNNRVVFDLDNISLTNGNSASGRIRLKTHTGSAISLPDGTQIMDGQVLSAASLFSPNFWGGADPEEPEGLDCQTEFGPHFGSVLDGLWFESSVWQWRPLMPVPALSSAGKFLLLGGICVIGIILIARARRTVNA